MARPGPTPHGNTRTVAQVGNFLNFCAKARLIAAKKVGVCIIGEGCSGESRFGGMIGRNELSECVYNACISRSTASARTFQCSPVEVQKAGPAGRGLYTTGCTKGLHPKPHETWRQCGARDYIVDGPSAIFARRVFTRYILYIFSLLCVLALVHERAVALMQQIAAKLLLKGKRALYILACDALSRDSPTAKLSAHVGRRRHKPKRWEEKCCGYRNNLHS